jgi:hypothetical protein
VLFPDSSPTGRLLGLVFAFAAVAPGQRVNWSEPIAASPKRTFRNYGLRVQSEIPIAQNTVNESLDAWNARFDLRETQSGKSAIPESQLLLQPGILHAAEQASVNLWSMAKISTGTRRSGRKSWISVGPGSLPLSVTIQPDATQKYGAAPAILQQLALRRLISCVRLEGYLMRTNAAPRLDYCYTV